MATVSTIHTSDDQAGVVTPSFRAGQGSPLVLLHGVNCSWRVWRPVLPLLTGRHDVFVPTMPGHRGGPVLDPDGDYGVTAIVDMLCRQLDDAGIDTAHVAGNSLGGWVAIELARRGRARSVTAISPAGCWTSRRDLVRLLGLFRVARAAIGRERLRTLATHPTLSRVWLKGAVRRPGNIPVEDLADMVADAVACTALTGALGGRVALRRMEPLDVALCPVRVAWAQYDRTIPYRRYGHPMRAVIPGAEFVTLPGVGHMPMADDPALVARHILDMTSAVDEAAVDIAPRRRRRGGRTTGGGSQSSISA